jgi:hypothetical protein
LTAQAQVQQVITTEEWQSKRQVSAKRQALITAHITQHASHQLASQRHTHTSRVPYILYLVPVPQYQSAGWRRSSIDDMMKMSTGHQNGAQKAKSLSLQMLTKLKHWAQSQQVSQMSKEHIRRDGPG